MDQLLLVVAGGAIALLSSVTVTWLQGRHSRKNEDRAALRQSNRELTRLFITERDAPEPSPGAEGATSAELSEAEMLTTMVSDRRTRERLRDIIRLLRECHLPEMEELSGVRASQARQLLCSHALDVLGSHFRQERLPAAPAAVQRMLKVEDEALNIHTGGAVKEPREEDSASAAGDPEDTEEPLGPRKVRRKPRGGGQKSAAAEEEKTGG